MSGKEQVLEAVAKMPEESTFEELVESLQLLAAIREGQEQIRRGQTVPHEQVEKEGRSWITK